MLARILNLAWKDLLHVWHNRLLLVLVIFGAATELLLMGFATGAPIDDLKMAVVDADGTAASQGLIDALDATDTLDYDAGAADALDDYDDRAAALDDLFTGSLSILFPAPVLLVEIPDGFADQLAQGQRPDIALTINGANSLAGTTARRAAEEVITEYGAVQAVQRLASAAGLPAPTSAQIHDELVAAQPAITVRYNEELDRAHYTTPSEAAFVLYIMTIFAAALLLSREREYGTFEQLLVMPMRPFEIIIGKAIPSMAIGYTNFLLLLGIMNVVFGIPVRGSLALLLVLALGYLFVELGRGFLVAMTTRTQNQALLVTMLIAFVDITFSGYAVPVESMPQVMQSVANFFPIRHWMIILRGILQKDAGLDVLWPQLVWLLFLGVIINSVTLVFFRRTLGEQR